MAESAVSFIVEKLSGLLSTEAELLLGVREEVQAIRDELDSMKAFLRSAEEKQHSDPQVKIWVKQVRELAYDAEDCIDEYRVHLTGTSSGRGLTGLLRRVSTFTRKIGARHRVAVEIRRIKSEAQKVSERSSRYGFTRSMIFPVSNSIATTSNRLDHLRMKALYVEEAQLAGIEKPKGELIEWLMEESRPELSVLSVVGMGGLGKTTLVRKVYESLALRSQHFHSRAWITVSQSFEVNGLLLNMASQLLPYSRQGMEQTDTVHLIDMLRDHLQDKRYMVVFDDMWDMEAWDCIKAALPEGRKASRVMVTTRIETVANGCSKLTHDKIYRLQPLTPQQSRDLLSKRVFENASDQSPPAELEVLINGILKKCDGLPLAIVTIAGLLATKPNSKEHWQKVYDRLSSEMERNPGFNAMKQILMLSYDDLPYDLKPCFLYLRMFPEDHEILPKQVKRLWIAEGLVRGSPDWSSKEVAESYFNEFINRSMIQPSHIHYTGKIKTCRVHDLMLEFMVSKSSEENVGCMFDQNARKDMNARRLSFSGKRGNMFLQQFIADQTKASSRIRSLTFDLYSWDSPCLLPHGKWKLLRVLNIQMCAFPGPSVHSLLNGIGKLYHLKYLSILDTLRENDLPVRLPNSWENLSNLERMILDMQIQMPAKVAWKLQKLCFLYARGVEVEADGIRGLKALQTLYNIKITSRVIEELGKLTEIRKLVVRDLREQLSVDLCASISNMSLSLRSLEFNACDSLSLEPLPSPPLELKSLSFIVRLKQLPGWVASLSHLAKLILVDCGLGEDDIRVLASLPNLIHLKLSDDAYIRTKLCFIGGGFQLLKTLVLIRLFNLESLRFELGALPNLEILYLNSCRGLEKSGDVGGMEHLPRLQRVLVASGLNENFFNLMQSKVPQEHPDHPRVEIYSHSDF